MMKNDKTRNVMLLIAGGYLVYLGITLIEDVMTTDMENEMMFLGFGIVYVILGGILCINKLIAITKSYAPSDIEETGEIEEIEEIEKIEAMEEDSNTENIEEI